MNRFMRTLRKTKGILAAALALSFVVSGVAPVAPMNTVLAAAHGDKLVLNKNKIKLNGTTTFTAEGKYASYDGLTRDQAHQLNGQFNTPQYSDIKTTIKTKKSTSGKKTKVKFNVTLDQLSDPQIDCGDTALYEEGDWNTYLTMPHLVYTVFDYKTGKSIETGSDKVKVKVIKDWEFTYYPDQTYKLESYDGSVVDDTLKNFKTGSVSFSVTYPSSYKNAVVGIGFVNIPNADSWYGVNNDYWGGTIKYGKTDYYKLGKKNKSMAYIRLK